MSGVTVNLKEMKEHAIDVKIHFSHARYLGLNLGVIEGFKRVIHRPPVDNLISE